jgi:tRNA1Val (adenine37-N6)-methyltransferase
MGNSWFQFKEFRIEQSRSAMKVCSDSCLFAALVAEEEGRSAPAEILDPGCGTGLLSLLLAQKFSAAQFTGIELDSGSVEDCLLNFQASPWAGRLRLLQADFCLLAPEKRFDLIVCNPPFFISHLPSPHPERRGAMHSKPEELDRWISSMAASLKPNGKTYLLLSESAAPKILPMAEKAGMAVTKIIRLLRAPSKVWRVIICLMYKPSGASEIMENLVVQDENGRMNLFAQSILKPYY